MVPVLSAQYLHSARYKLVSLCNKPDGVTRGLKIYPANICMQVIRVNQFLQEVIYPLQKHSPVEEARISSTRRGKDFA